ncbi:MAG: hypothetical protein U0586_05270 [Candidatus Brocadiaceae bacterium]
MHKSTKVEEPVQKVSHCVIASGAKQSFPHKQTSPPDKKYMGL